MVEYTIKGLLTDVFTRLGQKVRLLVRTNCHQHASLNDVLLLFEMVCLIQCQERLDCGRIDLRVINCFAPLTAIVIAFII